MQRKPFPKVNNGPQKWKLVRTDGLARETISDRLVAENIANHDEAKVMLQALRDCCAYDSSVWYQIYEQEKPLYVFNPSW